ncbi:MAG: nicotinate-nucleotide--dimethylbenzimidazole phosphoribosyltransferase [Magnetococcales bacterium]|nr:nicotinate-nucleotide--dimethylbenzimidazole phosphoribosyltransferase [Magnetococcales bacterium]
MVRPEWLDAPLAEPSEKHRQEALNRQGQLTKPPGSLGVLEKIAVDFAGWQNKMMPELESLKVVVFAGDHGVVESGVSAFPQSVTVEMVKNFSRGGAAITVLAKHLEALFEVVDVGTANDPGPLPGVVSSRVGAGTADMSKGAAMDEKQLYAALEAGRQAAIRGNEEGVQLLVGGEMGIGNTTAAAAVGSVLTGLSPALMAGPGTGLDSTGVANKALIIQKAIDENSPDAKDPLSVLRKVGGFELAALSGFYITSAQLGIPILVDGFITTSAALAAVKLRPELADWMLFAHLSEEPGHSALLAAIGGQALVDLEMRLGEGSGAAVAVPLLKMACSLHSEMATFAQAGVSQG